MTAEGNRTVETWRERCLRKYYFGRPGWLNGTQRFHLLVKSVAPPHTEILEIGAGSDNQSSRFFATLGRLVGLDVDPAVSGNTSCAEAWVSDGVRIPCEAGRFGLVVSDFALEHVADPPAQCREIARVLSPGGCFVFRTPNLFHYVSLGAWLTPHFVHELFANRLRGLSAQEGHVYPTYHRMNTRGRCHRDLAAAGLAVESMEFVESEPSYGMVSRLLFYPFMWWERLLNATPLLEGLRCHIHCVARKQPGRGGVRCASRS